jgi:hypothetical protein
MSFYRLFLIILFFFYPTLTSKSFASASLLTPGEENSLKSIINASRLSTSGDLESRDKSKRREFYMTGDGNCAWYSMGTTYPEGHKLLSDNANNPFIRKLASQEIVNQFKELPQQMKSKPDYQQLIGELNAVLAELKAKQKQPASSKQDLFARQDRVREKIRAYAEKEEVYRDYLNYEVRNGHHMRYPQDLAGIVDQETYFIDAYAYLQNKNLRIWTQVDSNDVFLDGRPSAEKSKNCPIIPVHHFTKAGATGTLELIYRRNHFNRLVHPDNQKALEEASLDEGISIVRLLSPRLLEKYKQTQQKAQALAAQQKQQEAARRREQLAAQQKAQTLAAQQKQQEAARRREQLAAQQKAQTLAAQQTQQEAARRREQLAAQQKVKALAAQQKQQEAARRREQLAAQQKAKALAAQQKQQEAARRREQLAAQQKAQTLAAQQKQQEAAQRREQLAAQQKAQTLAAQQKQQEAARRRAQLAAQQKAKALAAQQKQQEAARRREQLAAQQKAQALAAQQQQKAAAQRRAQLAAQQKAKALAAQQQQKAAAQRRAQLAAQQKAQAEATRRKAQIVNQQKIQAQTAQIKKQLAVRKAAKAA